MGSSAQWSLPEVLEEILVVVGPRHPEQIIFIHDGCSVFAALYIYVVTYHVDNVVRMYERRELYTSYKSVAHLSSSIRRLTISLQALSRQLDQSSRGIEKIMP